MTGPEGPQAIPLRPTEWKFCSHQAVCSHQAAGPALWEGDRELGAPGEEVEEGAVGEGRRKWGGWP